MNVAVKVVEEVSLEDETPLSPGGVPGGTRPRFPHDSLLVCPASQSQLGVGWLQRESNDTRSLYTGQG